MKQLSRDEINQKIAEIFKRNGVKPPRGEEAFWIAADVVKLKSVEDWQELSSLGISWSLAAD